MTPQIKSSTLYVGNLPADATRTEVEEVFGEAGPIKKCFVLKSKDAQSSYAFVTYALPEDTDTAAAELRDATVRGQQLTVSISNRKQKNARGADRQAAPQRHAPAAAGAAETKETEETAQRPKSGPAAKKQKIDGGKAADTKPSIPPKKKKKESGAKDESHAPAAPSKKGRLIVRNLSFKVTDESFRKHFAAVGAVTEVKLLKKPNGLLVGCGFVQFKHEKHAEEAIKKFNTKPFLGRPIVIDWAVDKTRYAAAQSPAQGGKKRPLDEEGEEEEDSGQGDEDGDSEDDTESGSPSKPSARLDTSGVADSDEDEGSDEDEDDEEEGESAGSEAASDEDEAESVDSEAEEGSDDDEEDEDDDDDEDADVKPAAKRKPRPSSDVAEGSTLFIKNLSFDTDQAALKEVFSQFGRVKYAVLCMDPLTEHPRGTAFVQFTTAEEAEAARTAAANDENASLFTLDDRRMDVLPAVDKDQLKNRSQLEKERAAEGKDKRNLYLAREGLVREGSRAAEGVSRADLNKRVGLEKWKTKMLRNLSMFVSPVRLCVHNIPVDWDDGKLRKMFQQHAPADARITEARVMRDRRDVSSHPRGLSKEYGFVTFTEHTASLAALRNINNNPEVFTNNRRPIVEFAVENRAALDARRKREEKSRQMNQPAPAAAPAAGGRRRRAGKDSASAPARGPAARPAAASAQPARPAHAGMAADPSNKRLPKLKTRAGAQENAKAITRKMLKNDKKGRRERAGHKKDIIQDWERAPAEKQKPTRRERKAEKSRRGGERPEDTKFTNLVDKYRQKLAAAPATAARWFQ